MQTKLLEILNSLLKELGLEALDKLDPQANLKEDIGLDSISYADLIVQIDDQFKTDINQSGNLNTIGDILEQLK